MIGDIAIGHPFIRSHEEMSFNDEIIRFVATAKRSEFFRRFEERLIERDETIDHFAFEEAVQNDRPVDISRDMGRNHPRSQDHVVPPQGLIEPPDEIGIGRLTEDDAGMSSWVALIADELFATNPCPSRGTGEAQAEPKDDDGQLPPVFGAREDIRRSNREQGCQKEGDEGGELSENEIADEAACQREERIRRPEVRVLSRYPGADGFEAIGGKGDDQRREDEIPEGACRCRRPVVARPVMTRVNAQQGWIVRLGVEITQAREQCIPGMGV